MGNSGSSHHQPCPGTSGPLRGHQHRQQPPQHQPHYQSHRQPDMARGWTQSFPRELSRHHHHHQQQQQHQQPGQPAGHKVLPEPPNQRLRATNNGSIIHNGGTISGRRPGALTLPHDLYKQGVFRSRSTSASNFGGSRSGRRDDHQHHHHHHHQHQHHCCQHPNDSLGMDQEMQELKRFGSEPDLRCSPLQRNSRVTEQRQSTNGYYPERESRYKNRKKYKAPPPPATTLTTTTTTTTTNAVGTTSLNPDGSSPDSYNWEETTRCRPEAEEVQAPPRRSRLFKTRAETKRAQVNWPSGPERNEECAENERRWRTDSRGPDPSASRGSQPWHGQDDPWSRDAHRRSKIFDGKNTLQRSMSSPEFQAELMQVARKVRNKLTAAPADVDDAQRRRGADGKSLAHRQELGKDGSERGREDRRGEESARRLPERSAESTRRSFKDGQPRTRSESPVRLSARDNKLDSRGQGSGRESTPEPSEIKIRGDKENYDPRRRGNESRTSDARSEKRWSETNSLADRKEMKSKDKSGRKDPRDNRDNWHPLPEPEKSTPKTFYFGMEEGMQKESASCAEQIQSRLGIVEGSPESKSDLDDCKTTVEDISLKLRPTLPKKQLEIPRFSPSAAWRLLSALEAPGPTMSTASEEIPVMFEERIERLSRPPPALVALSPRSSHDKSGDSGISGDAGAPNDEPLDVVGASTRPKTSTTRPAWTPQQDLGEESSSDAGVDSPPPMPMPMPLGVRFPPRAHVFSLSLPRDDGRQLSAYPCEPTTRGKDGTTFNSLQKLRRSVSGAFGLTPQDVARTRTSGGDALDDNWLLSSSAPTSLQHQQLPEVNGAVPAAWRTNNYGAGNNDQGVGEDEEEDEEEDEDVEEFDDRTDFPVIMKPPSFSYLAAGGHVMYLPESNGTSYQPQSLTCKTGSGAENEKSSGSSMTKYRKNGVDENGRSARVSSSSSGHDVKGDGTSRNLAVFRERSFVNEVGLNGQKFNGYSKSCENVSEMKQRTGSPARQNLQDAKDSPVEAKVSAKSNSKGRRFTFQSTVRQIERRRLAERLSREAEAKERQRKGELEAMRKVEEEFQRKRAREKANIRQQLRLYSMDESLSSLPTGWDSSQVSRADPDGAPSSSASSPTSAPPGKLLSNRKNSHSSDEYHKKRTSSSDSRKQQQQQQQQQQQREYKDYRPRYYDWGAETSSHLEYKQTTVHPKIVCDIPKSSPAFVDANVHGTKNANLSSTPSSDNYRKDFAHGAVAAKSSLASSDSELSQPNTRPHSRQAGSKAKPLRSRSASPDRSVEAASSEDERPVEPVKQERNLPAAFAINGVQPFVREKSYRPISFNPQPPPPPIPS